MASGHALTDQANSVPTPTVHTLLLLSRTASKCILGEHLELTYVLLLLLLL